MITIYTIAYNEEFMLPHFIKWYRNNIPDCKIVVYDNESTDKTKQIALENNCEVINYSTNNKLCDQTYLNIKNNCWKKADTDWVIVCDADEFLDINFNDLNFCTIVKSTGYNMCNILNLGELSDIKHGIKATQYDKAILFNKKHIEEINYSAGCHGCDPKGQVIYNTKEFNLYHMHFINEDLMVEKYKRNAKRLSENNKLNRWGYHYEQQEESIRESYKNHLQLSEKIK